MYVCVVPEYSKPRKGNKKAKLNFKETFFFNGELLLTYTHIYIYIFIISVERQTYVYFAASFLGEPRELRKKKLLLSPDFFLLRVGKDQILLSPAGIS